MLTTSSTRAILRWCSLTERRRCGRMGVVMRRLSTAKKNFFKLAQGEYVAAEKLEIIYGQSPLVSQIFVYGDSLRSFLVAMIVAEHSGVMIWAKEHGLEGKSFEELCKSSELKAAMKEDFARLMKENGLKGFERLVDFKILSQQWTTENGLLTPTFKLKRSFVKKA